MKLYKFFITFFIIAFLAGCIFIYKIYNFVFLPEATFIENSKRIYIPTGSQFNDVLDTLFNNKVIKSKWGFILFSKAFGYHKNIIPGSYVIEKSMNNFKVIHILRTGRQVPVNFTFNYIRTKELFIEKVSETLEVKEEELKLLLSNSQYLSSFGFTSADIMTLFIPNTYQFYWNTDARSFMNRMIDEYKKFWNKQRILKSRKLFLSKIEVSILASIVDAETQYDPEKPTIAGVYFNRLQKGMLLQADPTVVYAHQDFTIKRVTNFHKEIDSPYNTYKYSGLPPGPINIPSITSIDAVLNTEIHHFIYFCAKEDGSGRHNFAITFREHLDNALKYQNWLNKRNIH